MFVHLCSNFGFENEGCIVIVGMDVPVKSVKAVDDKVNLLCIFNQAI